MSSSFLKEDARPAPPGGSHPGGIGRPSANPAPTVRPSDRRAAKAGSGRRRYHELDLLRFVAAVAVVLYHYLFRASVADPVFAHTGFSDPLGIARYGYLGVDLFFVISGFVILNSAWNKRPSAFVASRIGRLYPAFWVACTLTALVVTIDPGDRFHVTFNQYLVNLTMTPKLFDVPEVDGVYWTLLVELKFYLLVLGLCMLRITRNRVLAFSIGWLAISVWHAIVPLPGYLSELLLPDWSPYFIAGILFSLVAREGWRRKYVLPLIVTYVWTVYVAVEFARGWSESYDTQLSPYVVGGVITAIFVVFALIAGHKLQWKWAGKVAFLGALTYPLYLLHEYIGFVLFELGHAWVSRWVLLASVLAVVTALAWALHVLVEDRCAAPLARWIQNRWDGFVAPFDRGIHEIEDAKNWQWQGAIPVRPAEAMRIL